MADVKIPAVGESVTEGMIETWEKKDGDFVQVDEVILSLETDKATVDLTSEFSGQLKILVEAGSVVKVGDVIAQIDTSASGGASAPAPAAQETASAPAPATVPQASGTAPAKDKSGPAARLMMAENQVDPQAVTGTGKDGRITKGDVGKHLAGQGGASPTPAPKPTIAEPMKMPSGERQERREPMTMLRRRIADRLLSSQKEAAILTTFNEVDMTEVMALRGRYKDEFQKKYDMKLGFMGFFLRASVEALRAFPKVNAYIDGTDVVYHSYSDVGVAVSTEKGLMVPIIRDVDQMSIPEIELAIAGFAKKARDNKISLDDLTGGTFTVSNGGVFGSLLSTPIINPPQSAILGMHKTQQRPMVMPSGEVAARPMMYLALSYDHRIIDGKEAVGFLVKIKECIEDPSRMLLGV